ncbi:hypothetical protein GCM10010170_080800 [Dactylosporangium salmoneum]|uniref:Uncharacterized protein n=1 Tax=Dactylosporangium salmoneum TaxID=53361 RepID=A0ABP5UEY2_9ACTN
MEPLYARELPATPHGGVGYLLKDRSGNANTARTPASVTAGV